MVTGLHLPPPHTGNGGYIWCLSSTHSLPVGFSILNKAMDVARSAPQGVCYHADVIYLLPKLGIKSARALWYSKLSRHHTMDNIMVVL